MGVKKSFAEGAVGSPRGYWGHALAQHEHAYEV